MVSTRSGRSTKHTYAERVLRAYSQAQREHRRQSVHLATLRAHVRRIADERKDKLGPKWRTWVGKAVRKLEEQGVLQPVDSSGYIRMTDEGKKALVSARRRVLGTTGTYMQTPGDEERVWRVLSTQFSPASHMTDRRYSTTQLSRKRRQSTKSRPSVCGYESGDESEDELPSVSSRATTKRRRITNADPFASASPSKPLSKMNKAELKQKVKELQSGLLALGTGSPRSRTRKPNAEEESLRKELHEARKELEAYRRRTAIFGDQDDELTDIDELEMAGERLSSPVRATRVTPPTPTPMRGRSQILVLGRTESGSLIHGVSKQPTPAPSDDEHWDLGLRQDTEYAADERDMGAGEDLFMDSRDNGPVIVEGGQVITPDMTPSRNEDPKVAVGVLHQKLSSLEQLMAGKDQEIANLRSELERKDQALASLAEKDGIVADLQRTLASKGDTITELRDTIAARDATITVTEGKFIESNAQLEAKDSIIHELRTELERVRTEKGEVEARVIAIRSEACAFQEVIEKTQQDHADALATIENIRAELAKRDTELTNARAILSSRERTISELNGQAEAKDITIDALRSELTLLHTERKDLETRLNATRNEAQTIQEALERVQSDHVDAQATIVELEAELESTRGRLHGIEERYELTEALLSDAKKRLSEVELFSQTQRERLIEKDDEIAEKDTIISDLESRMQDVAGDWERARSTIGDLASRLVSTEAQQVEREDALRSVIEVVRKEKDDLTVTVSHVRTEKATLDAQNEELQGQVSTLSGDLRAVRADLAAAKETTLRLLGVVDEAHNARDEEVRKHTATKEALSSAKADVTRLRGQAHEAEMEIQKIRGELAVNQVALVTEQTATSMLRSDLTMARGDLDVLRAEVGAARMELADTKADVKIMEEEAEALRAAKKADENTIINLKMLYERLKQLQGEWMSELDKKLTTAQSAPMPPRLESVRRNVATAAAPLVV